MNDINSLKETGSFIHQFIKEDLKEQPNKIITRFPPEPNGYLHIGHAKSIHLNFGLANLYGGITNLRFDDTNPEKEEIEYVDSIKDDIHWLGFDWEDRLYFASDYFEQMYAFAIDLIKQEKAFVCDLTAEEVREYRGTLNEPGKESPHRNRTVDENLDLLKKMRDGEFEDGAKTLRAKINMSSSNINMRDPVMYRIVRFDHYRTGDKWLIYPMYDFAHPIGDAIEGITHSICTMEFEDHKPLYNWFVNNLEFGNEFKPRQIEFAKLVLTNTVIGKRYIKQLVDAGEVDGWDDPRLLTISGMRRRGYTPESIKEFCEMIGISKADNRVDIAMLEFAIRNDLNEKSTNVMAVLDPIKVTITNYDEDKTEMLLVENNPNNEELGSREVPFGRELYIERNDFAEIPPKKYNRLTLTQEVRLRSAYFIKCNEIIKDENGNIVELLCTYDPETKSGSGFTGRKVKGTIHWVNAKEAIDAKINLYDYLVFDDEESEGGVIKNPNSLTVAENAKLEPFLKNVTLEDRFQFIRTGYFCIDNKTSTKDNLVFNRIVELKSSYKPKKS